MSYPRAPPGETLQKFIAMYRAFGGNPNDFDGADLRDPWRVMIRATGCPAKQFTPEILARVDGALTGMPIVYDWWDSWETLCKLPGNQGKFMADTELIKLYAEQGMRSATFADVLFYAAIMRNRHFSKYHLALTGEDFHRDPGGPRCAISLINYEAEGKRPAFRDIRLAPIYDRLSPQDKLLVVDIEDT